MDKRKSIFVLLLVTMTLALPFELFACKQPDKTTQTSSEFNFIFRYGVGAKNELDTFKGTFTKDMILAPSITVPLSLTEDEKNRIMQKMKSIGFFDYPDVFEIPHGPGVTMITPFDVYYFRVEYDTVIKELNWNAQIINPNEQASKLKELIQLIENIIWAKPEYKNLPQPRGGYL